MTVFPIFSTPVFVETYEVLDEDIQGIINEQYREYPKRRDGEQSIDTQIFKKYPRLHDICLAHVKEYVYNVLSVDEDRVRPKIICSWVNKHRPDERANRHGHTNSMFTGCIYLQIPENSGNLIFEASYNHCTYGTGMIEPPFVEEHILNSRVWQVVPERGMVALFPGHVDHMSGYNESEEDRYTIGFNVMLEGDFSEPTRDLVMEIKHV
tara:strand:+ start:1618 stop:2244 length:627 start_codon:yes stop_codon:yes gene_type:complete